MQKQLRMFILLGLFLLTTGNAIRAQAAGFQLSSPTVTDGGFLAAEQVANGFGCSGGNLSPEVNWTGAPEGSKSFGVTFFDLDAPTGSGLWHWVVFNIPANTTALKAGAGDPAKNLMPAGSIQARNDTGPVGYLGACPPTGDKPHRYVLTVFALNVDKLPLDQNASGALVGFYMNANQLAKASLTVYYGRTSDFQLSSPVVKDGGTLSSDQVANSFGCSGGNTSPELRWTGAPDGTKSYVLSIYDADAPTGSGFWHWTVFNIPATITHLAAGTGDPTKGLLPEGAVQVANDAGTVGFIGACPAAGDKPHHYLITLIALKIDKLPLDQTASAALIGFYANANSLGRAFLTLTYGR